MQRKNPKILAILGPTASGKSDLAVSLARRFNGEIVSADSRQVYKGMDIGTGKITKREMRGIPHYCLDIASPKKVFTAADYEKCATEAIKKILSKEKLPIICGGTGFYINSAVYENALPDVPPSPALRRKIGKMSVAEMFKKLKELDPDRAASIDPKNPRRLVRALEIVLSTGKKVPAINRSPRFEVLKIGITFPPEKLRARIHLRLLKRLRAGMINEVRRLKNGGVSSTRLEDLGLEYRHVARYLRGLLTKQEMTAELENAIWRYAKRQMTWFKREKDIHWVISLREAETLVKNFNGIDSKQAKIKTV